jgi:hypothetical protein
VSATPPATTSGHADGEPVGGEVRAASADARRFLEDYLRYLHGRLPASRIRSAAPPLRDELAATALHASDVARRRPVRIAELHTQLLGTTRAQAWARVLDGRDATLTVALALRRTARGWEVGDVTHR